MDTHWLAWAAGIIDGEAGISVSCRKGGRRFLLNLGVNTTDRAVAEKLAEIIGGKVRARTKHHSDPKNHRPVWRWWLCSESAVEALELLSPWLIAKRAHFVAIRELWSACHGTSRWEDISEKLEPRIELAKRIGNLAVKGRPSPYASARMM